MMKKKNSFFYHGDHEGYRRVFCRIARKLKKRDFVAAESFAARDEVCRVFAAECFALSKSFAKAGNEKLSLQYAKLAARLLGLSLRPKKLADLDELKKALAELKADAGG